jgi:hypothetical protein
MLKKPPRQLAFGDQQNLRRVAEDPALAKVLIRCGQETKRQQVSAIQARTA